MHLKVLLIILISEENIGKVNVLTKRTYHCTNARLLQDLFKNVTLQNFFWCECGNLKCDTYSKPNLGLKAATRIQMEKKVVSKRNMKIGFIK